MRIINLVLGAFALVIAFRSFAEWIAVLKRRTTDKKGRPLFCYTTFKSGVKVTKNRQEVLFVTFGFGAIALLVGVVMIVDALRAERG